jgi:hypothetical protein
LIATVELSTPSLIGETVKPFAPGYPRLDGMSEKVMSHIRVNELARQLEMKSREVIDRLHELGIAQKVTHSSSVSEDQANQLRRYYAGESPIASTQSTDPRLPAPAVPRVSESVMGTSESGVELYIDAAVLIGEPEANSWVDHSPDWRNQHAMWEHANQTISKPSPSQQDLSSAVIQLQRSVEHRDKLLDHLYSFEKIPGRRPGSKYETMADLKVIRPTLKIRLRDLRNRLMHEFDEIPLNVSDCEELADTAWYYLKATDHLAHQCISDFDLTLHSPAESRRI